MTEIMSRVHGTEMEWGVLVPGELQAEAGLAVPLTQEVFNKHVAAYLKDRPHVGEAGKCFIENGSRFYADINSKRETTTPEDTSYLSTTASELANEQLMYDVLCTPIADSKDMLSWLTDFSLQKRIVDDKGNTWGYHESYNVPSSIVVSREGLGILGIHLATRNIFTGSGFLNSQGKFWMNQKAVGLETDFSRETTINKPVVNLRDENLSFSHSERIHVTSGDPSMSPWATRMQLGTTSIVLALMAEGLQENDIDFEPLSRENGLAKFVKTLARNPRFDSSSFTLALEMQQRLVKNAKYLDLSAEQMWTLSEWEQVLYDLQSNPLTAGNRVEWILRRRMLERYQEKSGHSWVSEEIRKKDRQWDRIGPDSIGMRLRQTEWAQWMPDENFIQERKTTAPDTTRAAIRSKFIKAFCHLNSIKNKDNQPALAVDWASVSYKQRNIKIANPYATHSDELDELIRNSQKAA